MALFKRARSTGKAEERPGAVVMGGDYQGLGIVRSLGREGIPVCVIDDEHSISRYSRYATHGLRVADLRNEQRAVKTLLDVGRDLGLQGWILFPTRDELVATLSRNRTVLAETYRVPAQEWSTIRWIWDKRNTYQKCDELGIPSPKTWSRVPLEDLDKIEAEFPLVLKPAIKEHFFYATKAKAWRANNPSELKDLYEKATKLTGEGGVLLQELVPGDGRHQFSYCAFFKGGKAIGSMVTRRRRQHPHDFGRASTYVETIDLPALESLSKRFLRSINYYGLVEVEYKLDPRDGQFKLLDVNARTWGYHSLGSSAGVDFPQLLYRDQIAEAVEPCRGRAGVSWIRLLTDIPTAFTDMMRGRLGCRDYVESLRGLHEEAVFNREDPIPGLVECALLPYLMVKRGF